MLKETNTEDEGKYQKVSSTKVCFIPMKKTTVSDLRLQD
jgi:hypothetical protein